MYISPLKMLWPLIWLCFSARKRTNLDIISLRWKNFTSASWLVSYIWILLFKANRAHIRNLWLFLALEHVSAGLSDSLMVTTSHTDMWLRSSDDDSKDWSRTKNQISTDLVTMQNEFPRSVLLSQPACGSDDAMYKFSAPGDACLRRNHVLNLLRHLVGRGLK